MKTVAIIQARMGSNRLPGKVMMPLGTRPVLAHVIYRVQMIKNIHGIVLAVPMEDRSQPLISLARSMGVKVYVGSESNVLSRFYHAAHSNDAEIVVRLTADCPLLDPQICEQVISLRQRENAQYASNVWPRSFPKGLDCEVFTFNKLRDAFIVTRDPYDIEHVTPWIVRNSRRINLPSGHFGLSRHNWCLDTQDDYDYLAPIFDQGVSYNYIENLVSMPERAGSIAAVAS